MRVYGGYDAVDLGMGWIDDGVELVGDSRGRDFAPRDETGHGTHVAGIVAARGLRVPPGLAGRARLVPVRALAAARDTDGLLVGVGGTLDIDAAIKAGVEIGAHVLNMSFGTPESALEPAFRRSTRTRWRTPCRAARSRSRPSAIPARRSGSTPRPSRTLIAVGAVGRDGRTPTFPPGGPIAIWSRRARTSSRSALAATAPRRVTSHAAPFVSAAVALMLARAEREGVTLDAATCRTILRDSAQAVEGGALPEEVGAGILDAVEALRRTDAQLAATKEAKMARERIHDLRRPYQASA